MTGILKVDSIQSSGGTAAMTIDSSGDVSLSQMVADQWRLTAHFSTADATITGWERPDDSYSGYINGLTESSGVFSFTKTGLYKVDVHFMAQCSSGGDSSMGISMQVSTNSGSSFDEAALQYVGDTDTGNNNGAAFGYLLNVTDISTFRLKLISSSIGSNSFILGSTDSNLTSISFVKLASAQ